MRAFRWLGIIASALSVVMLANYGFKLGNLVAPLRLMLEWYDSLLHILIGWAEPYIRATLVQLLAWTNFDIHLYPHWRHIFVLLSIYLIKDDTQLMTMRGLELRILFHSVRGVIEFAKSALRLAPCLLIALATSVGAGVVPIVDGEPSSDLIVAAIVIVGVMLNEFIYRFGVPVKGQLAHAEVAKYLPLVGGITNWNGWTRELGDLTFRILRRGVLALVVIALALQIPQVQRVQSPILAIFAFLVLFRALYWLAQAHRYRAWEVKHIKERGDDPGFDSLYFRIFPPNIPGSLSFDILSIFLGAGLFVAANAGLQLLGV